MVYSTLDACYLWGKRDWDSFPAILHHLGCLSCWWANERDCSLLKYDDAPLHWILLSGSVVSRLSFNQRVGGLISGSASPCQYVLKPPKCSSVVVPMVYECMWTLVTADVQVATPISVWMGGWCHVVLKSVEWSEDENRSLQVQVHVASMLRTWLQWATGLYVHTSAGSSVTNPDWRIWIWTREIHNSYDVKMMTSSYTILYSTYNTTQKWMISSSAYFRVLTHVDQWISMTFLWL